jgi:CBS domain-containing protein
MPTTIADVMTPNPISLDAHMTIVDAARAMRERDIGDVVVYDGDQVCGIVTDRDITVRAVADAKDPSEVKLRDVCSAQLKTIEPQASVQEAVQLMRDNALRRLPVMDGPRAIGIVSLGDLALEQDPKSALADISGATPNT